MSLNLGRTFLVGMTFLCSLQLDATYAIGAFRHLKGEHNRVNDNALRVTLSLDGVSAIPQGFYETMVDLLARDPELNTPYTFCDENNHPFTVTLLDPQEINTEKKYKRGGIERVGDQSILFYEVVLTYLKPNPKLLEAELCKLEAAKGIEMLTRNPEFRTVFICSNFRRTKDTMLEFLRAAQGRLNLGPITVYFSDLLNEIDPVTASLPPGIRKDRVPYPCNVPLKSWDFTELAEEFGEFAEVTFVSLSGVENLSGLLEIIGKDNTNFVLFSHAVSLQLLRQNPTTELIPNGAFIEDFI